VLVPKLLVFTVDDRPRHVGADRAMTTLLGAFTFAPVVYRQSRGPVVTFHAEIPDVQLERLPTAVEALRALDDVTSIAVVSIPPDEVAPAPPAPVELAGGDGGSVRRRS
jgi:hypothetical protein